MQKKITMVLCSLLLMVAACEPKPDSEKLLDQLVVSTNYDTQADFTSYSTYSIPTDTIGFYSNASNDTIIVQNKSNFPRPVIETIQSNLDTRGYTKVSRTDNPDLGINVAVINDFNTFQQVVYPGGYGGYGSGYYYPYYYGYGSYYQPYVNTYTSNTGVLIIELVDLKNKTNDNKVRAVWTANMGDVYSTIDLIKQAKDAINQAFVQSPYLDKQ
jgi:hypothetical protein